MDPDFFADPDPELKNPDPFVFCLIYFKSTNENLYKSLIYV